jgi:hypothetical protein
MHEILSLVLMAPAANGCKGNTHTYLYLASIVAAPLHVKREQLACRVSCYVDMWLTPIQFLCRASLLCSAAVLWCCSTITTSPT